MYDAGVVLVQLIQYVGRRWRRMLHFNECASIMAVRALIPHRRIMDDTEEGKEKIISKQTNKTLKTMRGILNTLVALEVAHRIQHNVYHVQFCVYLFFTCCHISLQYKRLLRLAATVSRTIINFPVISCNDGTLNPGNCQYVFFVCRTI